MGHTDSAIVTFVPAYSVQVHDAFEITQVLSGLPGFHKLIRKYRLINAVLVVINDGFLTDFLDNIPSIKEIEYGEENVLFSPSSFQSVLDPSFANHYGIDLEQIRQLHGLTMDLEDGRGISVAMIDSGMAPHPDLPTTSFKACLGTQWHWHYGWSYPYMDDYALAELQSLAAYEESHNPFSPTADKSNVDKYLKKAIRHLEKVSRLMWSSWGVYADSTHAYSLHHGTQDQVYRPSFKHMLGQLRKTSIHSYNFIDDNLNINDDHGHGTQMAGIISGGSLFEPYFWHPAYSAQHIEIPAMLPMAELMVLKCYDKRKISSSNMDAMIRALEYAEKHEVDIIYIGLSFDPASSNVAQRALALNRVIQIIASKSIAVICPAGNLGRKGLNIPAACQGSLAITSVDFTFAPDGQTRLPTISKHSNYAEAIYNEEVAFAAFGGGDPNKLLTTDLSLGFSSQHGTSVAAAIAVGLFGKHISKDRRDKHEKNYEKFWNALMLQTNLPSKHLDINFTVASNTKLSEADLRNQDALKLEPPRMPLVDIIDNARQSVDQTASTIAGLPPQSKIPSATIGWGLIKEF